MKFSIHTGGSKRLAHSSFGKRLAGPAEARCPVGDGRTPLVAGRRIDDLGSPRLRHLWLLMSVRKVAAAENERAENGREIEWHLSLRANHFHPPVDLNSMPALDRKSGGGRATHTVRFQPTARPDHRSPLANARQRLAAAAATRRPPLSTPN
jgi:hypothetical protein